jgi:hypothetical protein
MRDRVSGVIDAISKGKRRGPKMDQRGPSTFKQSFNVQQEDIPQVSQTMFRDWVDSQMPDPKDLVGMVIRDATKAAKAIAKATVVPERGFKARIVTTLQADTRIALEAFSNRIRPVIQTLPGCGKIWSSDWDNVSEFLQELRGTSHPFSWIRSADLSTSTDTIPHDVLYAMVDGICMALDIPPTSEVYHMLLITSGPTTIIYPDGHEIISGRGTLMGSPMSFIFLNILHAFICEKAGIVFKRQKGDDLVFPCTRSESENYSAWMKTFGFSFSVGKDYLAKGFTFCELGWCPGSDRIFSETPCRRLRAGDKDSTFTLEEQLRMPHEVARRTGKSFSAGNKSQLAWFRSHGLDPYLPVELGGCGYPSPRGLVAYIAHLRAGVSCRLRWLLEDASLEQATMLLSEISYSRSRSRDWIDRRNTVEFISVFANTGLVVADDSVPPDRRVSMDSAVDQLVNLRIKTAWLDPRVPLRPPRKYRPSVPKFYKALDRVCPRNYGKRLGREFSSIWVRFRDRRRERLYTIAGWGIGVDPATFHFQYSDGGLY